MGQRSQIYVKYPVGDNGKYGLIANYYQWNYGERMISRAAHTIGYLQSISEYFYKTYFDPYNVEKLRRYLDVNFDMNDISMSTDIVKEWLDADCGEDFPPRIRDFPDYVFLGQGNNDGCMFLNLEMAEDGSGQFEIHYCFTDCEHHILDAGQYMEWESEMLYEHWRKMLPQEEVETCDENIRFIMENAVLMTEEELDAMIHFDYEDIPKPF